MSNGNGQVKPKMQVAIEHLDNAFTELNQAMTVLSSVVFDIQKGADFVARYRDSLIKTIEETGGDVTKSIEGQIRDYIPKGTRGAEKVEE